MEYKPLLAALILLAVLAAVTSKFLHRALAVILGGGLFILFHLVEGPIYGQIDWNVIFYLLGMMVITVLLKRTGFSQWAAIKAARAVKGHPVKILLVLGCLSAVGAALLGPIPSLSLFLPVSILLAVELDVSPVPYLVTESLAASIAGVGTFLGSPGALIISSGLKLSPLDYFLQMGPLAAGALIVLFIISIILFRRRLITTNERRARILDFRPQQSLREKSHLGRVLWVLGLVLLGSFLHPFLGVDISVISLTGAAVLMILCGRQEVDKLLSEVNWSLVIFISGMFVLSAGLVQTGIIKALGQMILPWSGDGGKVLVLVILWGSSILAALIGTVPVVILALPLLGQLGPLSGSLGSMVLWSALILGSTLGSSAGILGSPAAQDVLAAGGRNGFRIAKREYLKLSIPFAAGVLIMVSGVFLIVFPGVL